MIILDTNVISEIMSKKPDNNLVSWINKINSDMLFTTSINIAEINRGIARLPAGKRKTNLKTNFDQFIDKALSGRILIFDHFAADLYGDVCAQRENAGLHIDAIDLMIVAIAKQNKFSIATRNTNHFLSCGITLINPWIA